MLGLSDDTTDDFFILRLFCFASYMMPYLLILIRNDPNFEVLFDKESRLGSP
jgi:hypothetical protein